MIKPWFDSVGAARAVTSTRDQAVARVLDGLGECRQCVAAVATVEVAVVRPPGALAALACELGACLALLVAASPPPCWPACVAAVLAVAPPWFGPQLSDLSTPILLLAVLSYSVARWVAGPRGLLVIAVLLVDLTGDYLFTDTRSHNISDVFFVLSLLTPPYVLGKVTRTAGRAG